MGFECILVDWVYQRGKKWEGERGKEGRVGDSSPNHGGIPIHVLFMEWRFDLWAVIMLVYFIGILDGNGMIHDRD